MLGICRKALNSKLYLKGQRGVIITETQKETTFLCRIYGFRGFGFRVYCLGSGGLSEWVDSEKNWVCLWHIEGVLSHLLSPPDPKPQALNHKYSSLTTLSQPTPRMLITLKNVVAVGLS